ncbi:MAG: pre-peptidase C-terminal domain-containing protein [Thaumarchaeota archaeon]|nr:pre-peptidase C-terminal domain-containing protein [Nitrososphaerota archaeon]MCL5317393.1 pre-peptidase C-terminal domain-containing protein [Nitrososphaerota archaeon]
MKAKSVLTLLTILMIVALSTTSLALLPSSSAASPGDSFDTAIRVTAGRYNNTLLSGDYFYKIDLRTRQTLTLRLDIPEGSNYNLFLYDPNRNLLSSSSQPGSLSETIRLSANTTGTYYVKVSGTRLSGTGVYYLTALVTDFEVTGADWGAGALRPEAGPGDVGVPLQITVRNGGDYAAENLVATVKLPNEFSNSTGGDTVTSHLAAPIPSGQTGLFTFTVNIAGTASIGRHNLAVTLNYDLRTAPATLLNGSPEDLPATIPLLGKVNLAVSIDVQQLTPGETNTVRVQVRNTGSATASGIDVVLATPPSLILIGVDNHLHFEKIAPNQTVEVSVPLQVSSAAAGSLVQLNLAISYTDAYGNVRSTNRSLGFNLAAERTQFQVTDVNWSAAGKPLEIGPGDKGATLNVKVQNLGENPVTGLRGTLYLTSPFSKKLNRDIVSSSYGSTVQPGQFSTFEFVIDVNQNATIGRFQLKMNLGYLLVKDGQPQTTESINLTVPVLLMGKVDLEISQNTATIKPGETNPLSLSIINAGSGSASAVDVSISVPTSLALGGEDNHLFTQTLNQGESIKRNISLFVPLTAAGSTTQLTFAISYRDPYGVDRSITRTISLQVLEIEGAGISVAEVVWGSPNSPVEVNLGDRNVPVTLVVKNVGTQSITGLSAEIRLPQPLMNSTAGSAVTSYFGGAVQPGGTAQLQFKVDINENGNPGLLQLNLSVNYLVVRGELYQPSRQSGLTASLLLKARADVETSIEGTVITAETVNNAVVTVTNTGTSRLADVTVTITPPNTVSLATGSNRVELRDLKPGESRRLQIGLFASASSVGLPLQGTMTWTFRDNYGLQQSKSLAFGVIVKDWSSPITVSTGENVLTVGRVSEPVIEIRNTGDTPVKAVKVVMTLPVTQAGSSPLTLISGSNEWFFDTIGGRGSVTLKPKILPTLTTADNSYQVNLSINFQDSQGVSHRESKSISFIARGSADMSILEVNISPPKAAPATTVTVSGTLLNKGSTSALYTRMNAKTSDYISPSPAGGTYLGEVSPNAPFAFSLPLNISGSTPVGDYKVPLVFRYEDEYGKNYTFTREISIPVEASSAPNGGSNGSKSTSGSSNLLNLAAENWLYILAMLVAVVLIFVLARRRRVSGRVRERIAAATEES